MFAVFFFLPVALCHRLLKAWEVSKPVESGWMEVAGVKGLKSSLDIPKSVQNGVGRRSGKAKG